MEEKRDLILARIYQRLTKTEQEKKVDEITNEIESLTRQVKVLSDDLKVLLDVMGGKYDA